jgi:osmotically-inducible protein OsmY
MKILLRTVALGAVLIASPLWAAQESAQAPVKAQDADNTRMNARDRNAETMKPTDQSNSKADIRLAAAVRRAIENDKSLSTSAHNIKLVANGGVVTLRGPVASDEEKQKVAQIAGSVDGVKNVDNNLDVQVAKK